ncbi:hypothetical protein QTP70_001971 [Hemibagrus guttatus]|uniref:Uncharacterized protein n=1 Tax=Hemibagrus guttatus TaxID=175788 RepID=A0AAE0QX67_9TELE|nr:hypothetical protein QTP70_001971 [Hemibagrus guttatus]
MRLLMLHGPYGYWWDNPCGNLFPFICYNAHPVRERQILRLQVKSDLSIFDSDVQSAILELMARTIGHSTAALVATERHLWLNLTRIKDRDKSFLLDAPISPQGLFGETVSTVIDWHQEVKCESAEFMEFIIFQPHLSPQLTQGGKKG